MTQTDFIAFLVCAQMDWTRLLLRPSRWLFKECALGSFVGFSPLRTACDDKASLSTIFQPVETCSRDD